MEGKKGRQSSRWGFGVLDWITRKREKCVKGSHPSLKYAEADRPRSMGWLEVKSAFWGVPCDKKLWRGERKGWERRRVDPK